MTACVGNLFYLAPEVYTGEHYTESADIYSFGILMWEVVARESPHGGINPQVSMGREGKEEERGERGERGEGRWVIS